ncbi:ribosome-associated translation inhibitor RaiA [Vibrio lentus]|nr:ribosome-associated translation inhibitor RaiA [Vibrio lentus]
MKMNITGKNIDITSAIRDHIESKFKKLDKWQVDIIGCQASFSEEPNKKKKFEAVLTVPKANLLLHQFMTTSTRGYQRSRTKTEARQLGKPRHKPEARRAEKPKLKS